MIAWSGVDGTPKRLRRGVTWCGAVDPYRRPVAFIPCGAAAKRAGTHSAYTPTDWADLSHCRRKPSRCRFPQQTPGQRTSPRLTNIKPTCTMNPYSPP